MQRADPAPRLPAPSRRGRAPAQRATRHASAPPRSRRRSTRSRADGRAARAERAQPHRRWVRRRPAAGGRLRKETGIASSPAAHRRRAAGGAEQADARRVQVAEEERRTVAATAAATRTAVAAAFRQQPPPSRRRRSSSGELAGGWPTTTMERWPAAAPAPPQTNRAARPAGDEGEGVVLSASTRPGAAGGRRHSTRGARLLLRGAPSASPTAMRRDRRRDARRNTATPWIPRARARPETARGAASPVGSRALRPRPRATAMHEIVAARMMKAGSGHVIWSTAAASRRDGPKLKWPNAGPARRRRPPSGTSRGTSPWRSGRLGPGWRAEKARRWNRWRW